MQAIHSYIPLNHTTTHRFFTKKVGYMPEEDPTLPYIKPAFSTAVADIDEALDVDLAASGVNIMCEYIVLKRPRYEPWIGHSPNLIHFSSLT